jgi:hypothetical protein
MLCGCTDSTLSGLALLPLGSTLTTATCGSICPELGRDGRWSSKFAIRDTDEGALGGLHGG